MPAVFVLCLTATLALLARFVAAVGPVVRCEPCDAVALLQCKPLPKDCAVRVREPGCGCCMTCALGQGQACGVYTARCGSGLTCQHQPGESRPLQALLEGRGVCTSEKSKKLNTVLVPAQKQDHGRNQEDGYANKTATMTVLPGLSTVKAGQSRGVMDTRTSLHNKLIKKDQNRKTHSYKVESVSEGASMDMQNFSVENKRETEYGPCRREMESILNSLKISNVLNPRGFRIPNCDRRGFYKKKQCRPSKGRRRGYCWCVDKYGQPLPGYDSRDRDEKQCHNRESQ
ncbi:insulin-like growth factor-binding protein 3 [Dunckerocampus dactyliophorus]|uniref:insulin-like growth factor-binding protein 3 n=1 Tax=Dunckerocampus dactyliophorus TaxID=161453 RepID=UPI002404EBAD|nr:insulin-like growth factor-binding protein 3 [Dunckerocampus dactyliophorus]